MDKQKESLSTRPLFDSAVKVIASTLEEGNIDKDDKEFLAVALMAFNGHIKILNSERARDALRFNVSQALSENIEGLKATLQQQLPEYVGRKSK